MKGLLSEIRNEIKKVLRPQFIFKFALIVVVVTSVLAFAKRSDNPSNWKSMAIAEMVEQEKELDAYKKREDAYLLFIQKEQENIDLLKYRVEHNITTVANMLNFTHDMFIMKVVAIIFIILLGANTLCIEYSHKTLLHLIMRPIKKEQILWAKLATIGLAAFVAVVFFVGVNLFIGLFFFGMNSDFTIPIVNANGSIIETDIIQGIISGALICFVEIFTYGIIACFLASIIKKESTVVMLTMLFWFFGGTVVSTLPLNSAYTFLLLPESLRYISHLVGGPIQWDLSLFIHIVTVLVYDLICIGFTLVLFNKDITFKRNVTGMRKQKNI